MCWCGLQLKHGTSNANQRRHQGSPASTSKNGGAMISSPKAQASFLFLVHNNRRVGKEGRTILLGHMTYCSFFFFKARPFACTSQCCLLGRVQHTPTHPLPSSTVTGHSLRHHPPPLPLPPHLPPARRRRRRRRTRRVGCSPARLRVAQRRRRVDHASPVFRRRQRAAQRRVAQVRLHRRVREDRRSVRRRRRRPCRRRPSPARPQDETAQQPAPGPLRCAAPPPLSRVLLVCPPLARARRARDGAACGGRRAAGAAGAQQRGAGGGRRVGDGGGGGGVDGARNGGVGAHGAAPDQVSLRREQAGVAQGGPVAPPREVRPKRRVRQPVVGQRVRRRRRRRRRRVEPRPRSQPSPPPPPLLRRAGAAEPPGVPVESAVHLLAGHVCGGFEKAHGGEAAASSIARLPRSSNSVASDTCPFLHAR